MKRLFSGLALVSVLTVLLAACASSKPMEVVYTIRSAAALKNYTVYLKVTDRRYNNDLVGEAAKEKGLFDELQNGLFDLTINLPNGGKVAMTGLSAPEAVWESAANRLKSQGVAAVRQRAAAQLTMEIVIDEMNIDVADKDLVATVALNSSIYRDTSAVAKSNAKATANRIKLIGGAGGATVLSEALSQAMNDLDFGGVNNF